MSVKRVYIASDHAGYKVKKDLVDYLSIKLNLKVSDCGPYESSRVDYPDYANKVCIKVLKDEGSFGVLVCGSGQGMSIRANKFKGIRAALCWNEKIAVLSREHNHANVLCLGARMHDLKDIKSIAKAFFTAEEEGGRHLQRVKKLSKAT